MLELSIPLNRVVSRCTHYQSTAELRNKEAQGFRLAAPSLFFWYEMVEVCVVLAGRSVTLPAAHSPAACVIARLHCIMVRRLVRFSSSLELGRVCFCNVRALAFPVFGWA